MSNKVSIISASEQGNRFERVVQNAMNAGQICQAIVYGREGTEVCILDLIDDLAAVLGQPTDEEIIETGSGFANKLNGMAADAVVKFAGQTIVISDGPEDDTFEVKAEQEGSFHAIYSFDDDIMLVDTLNNFTEEKISKIAA